MKLTIVICTGEEYFIGEEAKENVLDALELYLEDAK
jgi:hypothetical protein